MAKNPYPRPIDREFEEVYEDDPELDARLDELERLDERGELKFHEHSEVVARLRQLGVPLDDGSPASAPDR